MPRSRVLSFMSQWGGPPRSPTTDSSRSEASTAPHTLKKPLTVDTSASPSAIKALSQSVKDSPSPTTQQRFRSESRSESRSSRPLSMMQTYQPPVMDVQEDTLPELQPIFTFLNSHSNKLYQEGYFLKLHDLDSRGRPSSDRVWNECFAQLVGTVLSLWDAAALDAAGEDGEVVPTFVNLSDAAIKMIESLPMNGTAGGTLQNVLSISTAANNRYLLHFNSLNSLTQWTAGIRLATYEHATLQEAYTGSLIAGKGKMLNNIRTIMERSKFKSEDWVRVRFGAGTPWRRCWCVITPPDEKEYHKAQKTLKKRGTYDRTVVVPKGDLKFYDTRRVTKKTRPIATITDAYAAYAIYPQSKPLIDQSTLVKIEGLITIHGNPDTSTEGFVFIMPEVHPAVTGFEMMLRFLFPVFDTFALYGRPERLIADTLDQRGLMFAMPRDRRYGYLDILDVSGLIHTEGSQIWNDRQWRKELKKLTSHRMNSADLRGTPRRNTSLMSRASLDSRNRGIRFSDDGGSSSSPTTRRASPSYANDNIQFAPPRRTETAPMHTGSPVRTHNRSASEAHGYRRYQSDNPSRLSFGAENVVEEYDEHPPPPPAHGGVLGDRKPLYTLERVISEPEPEPYEDQPLAQTFEELKLQSKSPHPAPVASPPKFEHTPASKPARVPVPPHAALQRANSAMDTATLQQLADVNGNTPHYEREQEDYPGDKREVSTAANQDTRMLADASVLNEGMVNYYEPQARQKQRLRTIPGSPPYQGNSQYPPNSAHSPPPAQMYRNKSPDESADVSFGQRLASSHSISRKPVPVPLQTVPREKSPSLGSPSSNGSLRDDIIDHAMLEHMLQQSPVSIPSKPTESIYSADESIDYASSKASSPKIPAPRVRAGRLKTVGNPDLVVQSDDGPSNLDPSVPDSPVKISTDFPIDFGPTRIYKPTGRPATGSTTPGSAALDGSTPERDNANRSTSRLSMMDTRRNSYFDSRKEESNRRSVAWSPAAAAALDVSDETSLTPEQWVQHRAALASQPMVQSRATPIYSHSRQGSSSNLLRSTSKTPPLTGRLTGQQGANRLSRTPSGDWTQPETSRPTSRANRLSRTLSSDWAQQGANRLSRTPSGDWTQQETSRPTSRGTGANKLSRQSSGDWAQQGANRLSRTPSGDWTQQVPSRPTSRTAGAYLNPPSPGRPLVNSLPTQLSAREQMHVAQFSGAPMLNLSSKDKKRGDEGQAPGLIGAMAAREREREAIKGGMRSNLLQNEIVRRQQQVVQSEMEAQMQAQLQAQQQAQSFQMQQQQQAQAFMQQQQQAYAYKIQQEQQMQAMMQQEQLAQAARIQQEQRAQALKMQQEQAYQMQLQQQQQEQVYQMQLQHQQEQQMRMYGNRPTSQYVGQMGYGVARQHQQQHQQQQQVYGGFGYGQQADPRQQQRRG